MLSSDLLNKKLLNIISRNWLFSLSVISLFYFGLCHYWINSNDDIIVKGFSQWYDLPIHIKYIRHFLSTPFIEWFSRHPLNYNERFNYHFLPDLLSSFFLGIGFSLKYSLITPIILFGSLGLYQMRQFFLKYQKNILLIDTSIFCFLFLGGLNFIFFPYWYDKEMLDPSHFYFHSDVSNISLTPLTQIFFAQRGPVLGLFFFFSILKNIDDNRHIHLVPLLIHSFLLSISQFHGLIAVLLYVIFCSRSDNKIFRMKVFSSIFTVGLITYLLFYFSPTTLVFFKFNLFWMFDDPLKYVASFLFSFGFVIIFYLFSLASKSQAYHFTKFPLIVWIIINLLQFQPNEWDNSKILFFSLPIMSFTNVNFLSMFLRSRWILFSISILLMSATGVLSFYKLVFTGKNNYTLNSRSELNTAEKVQKIINTKNTMIQSKHNHFVMTHTDGVLYSSYFPVLKTLGHSLSDNYSNLKKVLSGDNTLSILRDNKIDYLVVYKEPLYSMKELQKLWWFIKPFYPLDVNLIKLRQQLFIVYEDENAIVFKGF